MTGKILPKRQFCSFQISIRKANTNDIWQMKYIQKSVKNYV